MMPAVTSLTLVLIVVLSEVLSRYPWDESGITKGQTARRPKITHMFVDLVEGFQRAYDTRLICAPGRR